MRCISPYLDDDTMINIYYTFFYPHLIYGIEFYGHAAKCHLNQILISQKTYIDKYKYGNPSTSTST